MRDFNTHLSRHQLADPEEPLSCHPYFDPICLPCTKYEEKVLMVDLYSKQKDFQLYWCPACGTICEITHDDLSSLKIEWTTPSKLLKEKENACKKTTTKS